ncbi:MAG: hypothetical protein O3B95_00985 [Chloroflexi bacterium]|nr:hypothetical protein [Chloroflexota bacterium]
MIDPRFQEVLEFIDETGPDGKPTKRALIALKIREFTQDVENQRIKLAKIEGEIDRFRSTSTSLEIALAEQSSRKIDLVSEAQDASVGAALAGSGGASAKLRRQAQLTRERVAEFDKDFAREQARLSQARNSLAAKEQEIKDLRDTIVRRLNTMSSLAERAGLEFGSELKNSRAHPTKPSRQQSNSPRAGAARVSRGRPRRVMVRRRRAS